MKTEDDHPGAQAALEAPDPVLIPSALQHLRLLICPRESGPNSLRFGRNCGRKVIERREWPWSKRDFAPAWGGRVLPFSCPVWPTPCFCALSLSSQSIHTYLSHASRSLSNFALALESLESLISDWPLSLLPTVEDCRSLISCTLFRMLNESHLQVFARVFDHVGTKISKSQISTQFGRFLLTIASFV